MITSESLLNYLYTSPLSKVNPPVQATVDNLPIEKVSWEDFERLCLRVVQTNYSIHDCEIYGVKGQVQEGIDIFARNSNGKYSTYQCRRYQEVTVADITKAVQDFENGDWLLKSERFVFCTSAEMNKTELQNEFERLKAELSKINISLEKWDRAQLLRVLKNHPRIVYDFFGKEWVKAFNGEIELAKIAAKRRLDGNEVNRYKQELRNFYSIVFNAYDPGIPNREAGNHFYHLQDRFVMPDAEEEVLEAYYPTKEVSPEQGQKTRDIENKALPDGLLPLGIFDRQENASITFEDTKARTSVELILTKNKNSIILGDPGSGKSTLLRNIVLDILSERPKFQNTTKHWGQNLPIWLPFAFVSRAVSNDNHISVEDIIKKWFESYDKGHLFDLVKEALDDERLLMVIDGIDESTDPSSAEQAISRIQIHVQLNNVCVIYSSRLYGFVPLKDSFSGVKEVHLLPFSKSQQLAFAFFWYERWSTEVGKQDAEFARRAAKGFVDDLSKSFELSRISENPLLLSILITQKLRDAVLPINKTKALEAITDYLINVHPIKRVTSANITSEKKIDFDLAEFFKVLAVTVQKDYPEGVIDKSDAKSILAIYLQNFAGLKLLEAKQMSDIILDIGANEYGIILEKSSTQISFTHKLFQEFLAAKYLIDSEDEYSGILSQFGGEPSWQQAIKFYFGLVPNTKPKLFKASVDLLGSNTTKENKSRSYFLKYDVVLTLGNSPADLAKEYFKEIINLFDFETNLKTKGIYWKIILNSLHHVKIKSDVSEYLFQFFPNHYRYTDDRIIGLRRIEGKSLSDIQSAFLIKTLINGNEQQKLDASYTIRKFIGDAWLLTQIRDILEKSSNPTVIGFAINSLITTNLDEQTKDKILSQFSETENYEILLFLIGLKVHLRKHTDADLDTFLKLQSKHTRSLSDWIVATVAEGWPKSDRLLKVCLETVNSEYSDEVPVLDTSIGWKILFQCFNDRDEVVARLTKEITDERYPFNTMDPHKGWPLMLLYFKDNTKVIPVVDDWILKQKLHDSEISYASLIGRSEKIKKHLMTHLPNAHFPHWITMALVEGWSDDKEVIDFLKNYFENNIKSSLSAHYMDAVFKDDVQSGVRILEKMIFDREVDFRDRPIAGLIKLDKEYFRRNVLEKFIKSELQHFPEDDFWLSRLVVIHTLASFFDKEQIVKDCLLQYLKTRPEYSHIALNIYHDDAALIDSILGSSLHLPPDLRALLVEKFGESAIKDDRIVDRLSMFPQESDDTIKGAAGVYYYSHLIEDSERIVGLCEPDVFYRGGDYHPRRLIAFCGYLISNKIEDYFNLRENGTSEESGRTLFENGHYSMANVMVKLFVENFVYIHDSIKGDYERFGLDHELAYWNFWAKYSSASSPSFPFLIDYIKRNEKEIGSISILDFLNRTVPKSGLLQSIALNLVKKDHQTRESYFAAEILGQNFSDDNLVFAELSKLEHLITDEPKIVGLCVGWPDTPELRKIFEEISSKRFPISRPAGYHLKFLFRSVDEIMEFLGDVLIYYGEFKFEHRYFLSPFLRRVKKDSELKCRIKAELLVSNSSSVKVSYYSVLKRVGAIDGEILRWKDDQTDVSKLYGYNILSNDLMSLSDIFYEMDYS